MRAQAYTHLDCSPLLSGGEMGLSLKSTGETALQRMAWQRAKRKTIARWAKRHGMQVKFSLEIGTDGWVLMARVIR